MEAELALSRRIQRSLIPLTPPTLRGFEVATHYEAAREVGGDFFDVFPLRDRAGRAGIVIADVTGKGIAAALLMAFTRPLMRSALDQIRDPVAAVERTNKILVEERRSALFITALAGVLDLGRACSISRTQATRWNTLHPEMERPDEGGDEQRRPAGSSRRMRLVRSRATTGSRA